MPANARTWTRSVVLAAVCLLAPNGAPARGPGHPGAAAAAFRIDGCVAHFSGCGGSVEFGVVTLAPLGRTAAVDLGFFAFDGVPPGTYTLAYSPPCNPAGCTGPVTLRIVDRDGYAAFHRSTCAADCSVDRRVTVDEVVTCVGMGLRNEVTCAHCDPDRDGRVSIADLLTSVDALLAGCR